jgi:hypothetical protein
MIRPPAGYYSLSMMHTHIVAAGCVLVCLHCGAEGRAPIPRLHPDLYSAACERFIAAHRACCPAAEVDLLHRGAA